MPIVEDATREEVARLLELFPIARLRGRWEALRGSKAEISSVIAEEGDHSQIQAFMGAEFGCCKQHCYVFVRPEDLKRLPATVAEAERVWRRADPPSALYLLRSHYDVFLAEPLAQVVLEFLWPFRIEIVGDYVVIRFIVLEKNLDSYYGTRFKVGTRTVDEAAVVAAVAAHLGLEERADLHKGIKALWDAGFMDSPRTRYKKPQSMATEVMDEERGIREHNPELYDMVKKSVIYGTTFLVAPRDDLDIETFSANPAEGLIGFQRYAARSSETDYVIHEIIRKN